MFNFEKRILYRRILGYVLFWVIFSVVLVNMINQYISENSVSEHGADRLVDFEFIIAAGVYLVCLIKVIFLISDLIYDIRLGEVKVIKGILSEKKITEIEIVPSMGWGNKRKMYELIIGKNSYEVPKTVYKRFEAGNRIKIRLTVRTQIPLYINVA